MIALEKKKLKNQVFFLNSLRIGILCALILVVGIVYLFFSIPVSILPLLLSLGVAVIVAVAYFPLSGMLTYRLLIFIQLVLDMMVITMLVYFSGGIVSPFYFLYILPIIVAAYFLSRRETFYIAFFCFIVFGILSNLLYLEVIRFFPGIEVGAIPLSRYIYNLLMSFIAFTAVAVLASNYFQRIRETGEKLMIIQENLQDMIILNNSVLEKMDSGFVTIDDGGRILSFNEKAFQMLGIDFSKNVFDLLFDREEMEKIKNITIVNNPFYIEKRMGAFDLGISVSVIEKISGYDKILIFLIADLTERKKIENELKEKESLAMIGQMLAGIAHEIRNPLASISGSVQFLQKEFQLAPEYQNLMNIIVRESERLSRSIHSILDFSKQTPLRIETFNLSLVLTEVVDMAAINYRNVRFLKRYSSENWVEADAEKIRQVIWNIVTNAIKAVDSRGVIELTLFKKDDALNLSVKDDGIGMKKDEIANVFSLFYSRFTAGVGLGMHVVKRIIDDHGFRIEIKSEKNRGTEVIICFKRM